MDAFVFFRLFFLALVGLIGGALAAVAFIAGALLFVFLVGGVFG